MIVERVRDFCSKGVGEDDNEHGSEVLQTIRIITPLC
jgi:hypothetical protein